MKIMDLSKISDTLRRNKRRCKASSICSSSRLGADWSYSPLLDSLLTFEIRKDRTGRKVDSVLILLPFNKALILNLSSQVFLNL